jgi:hypothetical protein
MASKRKIVRIVAGLLEFLRQVKMKIDLSFVGVAC